MGSLSTVFQAEVMAILRSTKLLIYDRKEEENTYLL
jgi:hypothetical protein